MSVHFSSKAVTVVVRKKEKRKSTPLGGRTTTLTFTSIHIMFVELALTSSSDAADGTTYLWNLHTGSMLGSFKQNVTPLQSLALVNNPRNVGSIFLSSQAEKGMMHVYNFQKVRNGS